MKKFVIFYWLFQISFVLMTFSGCATKIPITTNIINEVGGTENTKKFQCYVSKTITLKLVAENNATTIEGGQLIRRSETSREKIVIKGNLHGLVREGLRGNNGGYELNVAFEDYAGNPTLPFGQYSNERSFDTYYKLFYNDGGNHIVRYGNDRYNVSFDNKKHNGEPYLLIKMKKSKSKSAKARKAKGLKL